MGFCGSWRGEDRDAELSAQSILDLSYLCRAASYPAHDVELETGRCVAAGPMGCSGWVAQAGAEGQTQQGSQEKRTNGHCCRWAGRRAAARGCLLAKLLPSLPGVCSRESG